MFRRIFQTKFTAFIISAFLCLNLSGAFCVAFCQAKSVKAEKHHCPLAKTDAETCPMSKGEGKTNSRSKFANGISSECCNLAINVFAAKLEKHQTIFQTALKAENKIGFSKSFTFENFNYSTDFRYRKPLYDHRKARLKNCVFLI